MSRDNPGAGPATGAWTVHDERGTDEQLLEQVAGIARELSEVDGLQATLQHIVDLGEGLLEHCHGVSLMLIVRGGAIETPAASSQVAHDSDLLQYATGEGPCLSAIRDHETVLMQDLEKEERWPTYRDAALRLGVRSMVSFRLFVTDDSLGALDLYSRRPNAFDQRSVLLGQVFAAQASVALKAVFTEVGLQAAIRSRDVIGQAKGIVMARRHVTPDAAFAILRQLSQDRNEKLVDLAEQIAATGEVPS